MKQATSGRGRLRGLWLARELPFPHDTGDRIYSANLARSLAEAGVALTLVGLQPTAGVSVPMDWPIRWEVVPGRARSALRSLFSTMPLVAAAHATSSYRNALRSLVEEEWDFVVFDQYGLGWALETFISRRAPAKAPVLVHVAHDHEASVMRSLYQNFGGSTVKRLALWQNFLKTKSFEKAIASSVDLVTAITEEDSLKFSNDAPGVRTIVLKPGYSGSVCSGRVLDAETPRRVVLVGSFKWIAKQENLRQFLEVADPIFAAKGIEFQVVGFMPSDFAASVTRYARATQIVGPVENLQPYFDRARIADPGSPAGCA